MFHRQMICFCIIYIWLHLATVTAVLQSGTASFTLRDQDHTNKREGEWTRINTLGSYNVDEMVSEYILAVYKALD